MARLSYHLAVVTVILYGLFMNCAAEQTTESLVISKVEDGSADAQSEAQAEQVTEEHTPPIKLTEMDVKSHVSMRYAHTAVVAHVRNPAKRAQEANFRVLLPETAFISGFVMTINGKSYKAYVKEKEEAKQIYQDAVSQGIGAAHIAAKARNSNHFTVSVNVEPSSVAVFNLTYEELLQRRNGVYNHAINLHPGALVPKFTVSVNVQESSNITILRVPEMRTGNEIDATNEDPALSNVVITRNAHDASISFSPDLDEQQRLMALYQEKAKQCECDEGTGILGQFVVQYDVDRPNNGEVLVNDGYFVHFFAPSDLPPLHKYVVFVLDTSGSMMGRKIEQLHTAMNTILSELNPGDYFSIVDFHSNAKVHDLAEATQEPVKRFYYYDLSAASKVTLIPASPATPENIDKAKVIIQRLEANGGTNIESALNVAVDLINKRVELTKSQSNSTAVQAANDGAPTLEPMIIFLTDGDPTVGETNTNTIINHITEKNYGVNKAAIFALAFGEDADRKFLRKLSLRNNGFMRHIYEASDAALQLRDFYRQVSSPLLADVNFVYPPDQVKEGSVTKNKFRAYYAGSEVVVAGKVAAGAAELEPQTLAFCGDFNDGARKKFEKKIKVPVNKNPGYLPLERLWAYLSIKQLLDESDASDATEEEKKQENSPEKKALALALKYAFVTPLTSLVVVKPNETSAVDAESVDKQPPNIYTFAPTRPVALYNSISQPMFAHSQAGLIGLPGRPSAAFGLAGLAAPAFHYGQSYYHKSLRHYFKSKKTHRLKGVPRHEEEDFDALVLTTTPFTNEQLLVTAPSRDVYGLEPFPWTEGLLDFDKDTLSFATNATVTLKVTRNPTAPRASGGDASCSNAIDGGDGLCVYLTRCHKARDITLDIYKTTYCSVEGGYAGVCCSAKEIH
ncbi:hypothetical protein O3G_MSEX008075 [Manduca sexta]|uniref:Inter-alpha-trypsin inhibitor heavy chain H4-like n=1 Tax=Manduca sexta TaxID=7130 RepID=A0A922CNY9_MANSE|nr:hypothetical protein O3G_MSEX008075 [Manduca sexta]